MPNLNILISGGGIAGPCLAWWLHKGLPNSTITILERAPEPRTSGQAIDIREYAVDVVRRMGLIDIIKSKGTTEEGISFVYADGKTKATFPASGDEDNQGFTSEFEILRGDLAQIFYDTTKEKVRYQFGEYIKEIEEQGNGKVRVTFANHLQPTEYDLVVGADGMISKTRRVVWGKGPGEKEYLKSLGQYCAFFTIPKIEDDTKIAQVFNVPGGRISALRPDQYGETRAYLAVTYSDMAKFDGAKKAMGESVEAQKKWLENQFADALGEWQLERIVKEMKDSKDFYMQQTAQVKIDEGFVKGRVALLGDAGYCPSPISGMGTSTAIIGAYVLAGELSQSPDDIPTALERYQETMKPFIASVQKLIPGAPQVANPQTKLGITVFNTVMGIASSSWVKWVASTASSLVPSALVPKIGSGGWKAPEYPALAA